jgi:hypothetical protein
MTSGSINFLNDAILQNFVPPGCMAVLPASQQALDMAIGQPGGFHTRLYGIDIVGHTTKL